MTPLSTITIKTTKGDQQIGAYVFGTWAVHREFDYGVGRPGGDRWTISHVATGLAIPEFYTEDLHKVTAFKVAKALDLKFPNAEPTEGAAIVEVLWRVALGGKP